MSVFVNSDSAVVILVEKLALGVVNEPLISDAICALLLKVPDKLPDINPNPVICALPLMILSPVVLNTDEFTAKVLSSTNVPPPVKPSPAIKFLLVKIDEEAS